MVRVRTLIAPSSARVKQGFIDGREGVAPLSSDPDYISGYKMGQMHSQARQVGVPGKTQFLVQRDDLAVH